jgi:hypothetical protein
MLQLKRMEKRRELVNRDDVDELIDGICGVTLTHLSGWPARIVGLRRRAEAVLRELRVEISKAATKLADERGEPPLDQQG